MYPNIAIGQNTSAQVTVMPVCKPLPVPLSHLRGLTPNCFSCFLPLLIPVVAMLCTNSEQHQPSYLSYPSLLPKRPPPPAIVLLWHTAPRLRTPSQLCFFPTTLLSSSSAVCPLPSVPYLILPMAQSSPNNCFGFCELILIFYIIY